MPISRTLSERPGAETTKSDSKEGVEHGKENNYNSYPWKWKHGGGGEEASTKVWGKGKIIGHSGNLTNKHPYISHESVAWWSRA